MKHKAKYYVKKTTTCVKKRQSYIPMTNIKKMMYNLTISFNKKHIIYKIRKKKWKCKTTNKRQKKKNQVMQATDFFTNTFINIFSHWYVSKM